MVFCLYFYYYVFYYQLLLRVFIWANILNVLRQSSIIGIMAIGTTFVIIGGGFDISVGSILVLTAAMCWFTI